PSASATTSNGNDLLFGAVGENNKVTSFTEPLLWARALANINVQCGGSRVAIDTAYRVVAATGTYSYNPTTSGGASWADAIAAYKG
ncbi:MAG: hypothetical protein ACYDD7_11785, partial [Acidimicrobiales bacterium]